MHSLRFTFALLLGAFATTVAFAEHGTLVPAKDVSPEWLAKAQAEYPTDQCVVSEDKLTGETEGPVDFVYQETGKPDRLVRFCCKDCVKDFKKDPAKFLSEVDKAAAAKNDASKDHSHAHP